MEDGGSYELVWRSARYFLLIKNVVYGFNRHLFHPTKWACLKDRLISVCVDNRPYATHEIDTNFYGDRPDES